MFRFLPIALASCIFFNILAAHEMVISVDGETMVMDLDTNKSLEEIMTEVQEHVAMPLDNKWVVVEGWGSPSWLKGSGQNNKAGPGISGSRDYSIPLTEQDKKDIAFIVNTLADKSLATIFLRRSDLNAAGDRIDQIHPYRFLECIFSDEKLKVGARNIRRRGGVVWRNFSSGVVDTLGEESKKGALKKADFDAFIAHVKIDPRLVYPYIEKKKWLDFLENLIKFVERDGDHDRYDM